MTHSNTLRLISPANGFPRARPTTARGAYPPAEGLRAETGSVSAATPRRSVLARAGAFYSAITAKSAA